MRRFCSERRDVVNCVWHCARAVCLLVTAGRNSPGNVDLSMDPFIISTLVYRRAQILGQIHAGRLYTAVRFYKSIQKIILWQEMRRSGRENLIRRPKYCREASDKVAFSRASRLSPTQYSAWDRNVSGQFVAAAQSLHHLCPSFVSLSLWSHPLFDLQVSGAEQHPVQVLAKLKEVMAAWRGQAVPPILIDDLCTLNRIERHDMQQPASMASINCSEVWIYRNFLAWRWIIACVGNREHLNPQGGNDLWRPKTVRLKLIIMLFSKNWKCQLAARVRVLLMLISSSNVWPTCSHSRMIRRDGIELYIIRELLLDVVTALSGRCSW